MKFFHNGKKYTIEFYRDHKIVLSKVHFDDNTVGWEEVRSKYPYTYVHIREYPNPDDKVGYKVIAKAEQGCCPDDVFKLEVGRVKALRKLSEKIPKELRAPMWDCYMNRGEKKTEEPEGGKEGPQGQVSFDIETPTPLVLDTIPMVSEAVN